jgi:protein-tyrosine phosphatase
MAKNGNEGEKIRVMFVCLGNICRSPLAEGVFRKLVQEHGLESRFEIRSSGTGDWHVGQQADRRMRATALEYAVDLSTHCGAQLTHADLERFDHLLVMDKSNLHDVLFLDRSDRFANKVRLFREFDPEPGDYQVPDPYYGGSDGFHKVYTIVDRTARVLLHRFIDEYQLRG